MIISFESNKVKISKFGKVKVTIAGGLFLLDILEPNFYLNIASMNKICESNVWHSHFCHINFDTIARMSRFKLISKFNVSS